MSEIKTDKPKTLSPYRWYVLFMLVILSTFAWVDKQLILILQESIKADLGLSDTQLGLITGLGFAIPYTLFGIPVARLADRYNRRNIMGLALTFWSGVTALTGYAGSFIQLLFARFSIALGETGAAPPAFSFLADYFPKAERARVYAIRGMGLYFGFLIGFLIGGFLEEAYGWRVAFRLVGIPGVLFAIVFFLTVREPERGAMEATTTNIEDRPPFMEVLNYLLAKPTMRYLMIGSAAHAFVGTAYSNWMPPYLARVHGMGTAEIGMWLALAIGVCGAIGTFIGGFISDKFGQKDIRWYLWIPAISFCLSFPFALGTLFGQTGEVAMLSYCMPNILYAFFIGPSYTLLQDMSKVNMRATGSAIFMIFLSLTSGGGPLLAGYLSDIWQPHYGVDAIRYALFIIGFLEIIALYCFLKAAKTVGEDVIV